MRTRPVKVHGTHFALPDEPAFVVPGEHHPSEPERTEFPQPLSCLVSRVVRGTWRLSRVPARAVLKVPGPDRVLVIPTAGATTCFRMERLVFFSESVVLSTAVNLSIPWIACESPFVCRASGHGWIGLRIRGDCEVIGRDRLALGPVKTRLPMLVAWSDDAVLHLVQSGRWIDAVLGSEGSCTIQDGSLVVFADDAAARGRRTSVGDHIRRLAGL